MAEQLKINNGSLSIWVRVVFWAGVILFALQASTHMVAAGDTWVALACGRHFDNHGVDTVEPFSANSHEAGPTEQQLAEFPEWSHDIIKKIHPTGWINQNWLTHLLFYKTAKIFGDAGELNYDTLVYWKFGINILAAICVYYFARLLGVTIPGAAIAAAFAMYTARTFLDIRPAAHANLLVAAYLVILGLTTYRSALFAWLLVPLTALWANLHGGYIYVYIMLVPFFTIHLLGNFILKDRLVAIELKKLWHIVGAGLASFVAMVIFNPFHLTNLTHTFIISVSEHAESWRTVNEWHPAFEWENPVGQETAFLVLFIIMWIALAAWILVRFLRPKVKARKRAKVTYAEGEYSWPKIDLAMIAVAAATVYMAVQMRRFIPIAAFAACPVVAMFIEQTIAMVLARKRYNEGRGLNLPVIPRKMGTGIVIAGAVILIAFTSIWGKQFKRVYLDPWPTDSERTSMFMRMTASGLKPIDVCDFINMNDISGNMFNFWTEGGAIAFGQDPDPETGRTPLQLFMDGRAQAAYDHSKFILWRQLYGGGTRLAYKLRRSGRMADADQLRKIGDALDEEMKKRDIWVLLLPEREFRPESNPYRVNYLPKALPRHPNWQLAYADPHQIMYVDISTDQGRKLVAGAINGTTEFPTELSKQLTLARLKSGQRNPAARRRAFEHAMQAFEINAEPATAGLLYNLALNHRELRDSIATEMRSFLEEFEKNKLMLKNQDGYGERLAAASLSAALLADIYKRQQQPDLADEYKQLNEKFKAEQGELISKIKW
ncbi:hypothetical protein STSP2_02184 [Anaerohalosphaera lusitana]|uniref:Uncharacterized protein n=1 Tax=Anaerohalosphaera lusitana TaxID=1936003 RepID=A0A1U9NNB0_9BACT|nr:hypothetical protein [Anaerohalosphaera lusitana]AQT69006.1 hypothetical protein STSP2_02184 [Anaerohalosphaera lusitana]